MITSHWQPLFSKKMAVTASFSYKIGSGGLIFLQNWRQRPHFPTKLAAAASFSYKIGGGGLISLQNWRQRKGFGNITGGPVCKLWQAPYRDSLSI